jgi:alkanesulfonate monooxygenase
VDDLREQFGTTGRPLTLGLRTHLVIRDTEDGAWDAARSLIADAAPEVKAQRQSAIAGTPMVGQQAQARVAEDHRLGRHLWNGLSEVRVNCGSALVGTADQVADQLVDYWRLGIDEFILSGFPHVEECERAAEQLLPRLRERIESEQSS